MSQNHCYSICNFLILEIFISQCLLGVFSCQFNGAIELRKIGLLSLIEATSSNGCLAVFYLSTPIMITSQRS